MQAGDGKLSELLGAIGVADFLKEGQTSGDICDPNKKFIAIGGGNYDMVVKLLKADWGGVLSKTIGIFIADKYSPRFDHVKKEDTPGSGFKDMERITNEPAERNRSFLTKLKKNSSEKCIVASIMGSSADK